MRRLCSGLASRRSTSATRRAGSGSCRNVCSSVTEGIRPIRSSEIRRQNSASLLSGPGTACGVAAKRSASKASIRTARSSAGKTPRLPVNHISTSNSSRIAGPVQTMPQSPEFPNWPDGDLGNPRCGKVCSNRGLQTPETHTSKFLTLAKSDVRNNPAPGKQHVDFWLQRGKLSSTQLKNRNPAAKRLAIHRCTDPVYSTFCFDPLRRFLAATAGSQFGFGRINSASTVVRHSVSCPSS